ncbi:MAG: N-acetylmuramoyl-L-alanine amidase [Rickettsiales bacterium]|nr:N-acetylmuramoyl-L-alanine amidase [Rickettsiales bacterium]
MSDLKINKSKKFDNFFDKIDQKRKIDFLVLHHVGATSSDHAVEQFKTHQVSSHFLIDEKGEVFELVDENDISYHAGVSFWSGCDGLNKNSIGVEFINKLPFEKNFESLQMQAGVALCDYLIKKYQINLQNVVGHSDIAYNRETGFLDRKQDPSHLFDWKFLAKNNVAIAPQIVLSKDEVLFSLGDKNPQILEIKKLLADFGYKVSQFNDVFDEEMACLVKVFNRRFNQDAFKNNSDVWYKRSQLALNELCR